MEDFTSLLWVLLAGATVLFSAAKSKETKRKDAAKRARRAAETEQVHYQQTPPPLPDNTTENPIFTGYSAPRANTPTPELDNTPEITEVIDQTQEQTEEFDLRKAVIYSEILKPKFED